MDYKIGKVDLVHRRFTEGGLALRRFFEGVSDHRRFAAGGAILRRFTEGGFHRFCQDLPDADKSPSVEFLFSASFFHVRFVIEFCLRFIFSVSYLTILILQTHDLFTALCTFVVSILTPSNSKLLNFKP